jgi:virulence-associated protein VagC
MIATEPTRPEKLPEAELFESDGRQAVRLPVGMHLEGSTVLVRRLRNGILLEQPDAAETTIPNRRRSAEEVRAMFAYIDSLGADDLFPNGREQGVAEERLPIE